MNTFDYVNLGGDIRYVKDSAGQAMLAPEEASTTASKAYTVGDLFRYDGKLYRVKTNIAQGGTITIGTNCEETTIEEEIDKKISKPSGIPADKFLKIDSNGDATWGDAVTSAQISTATDAWLAQNITNPASPPLDSSLTLANAAAPADKVGELKSAFDYSISKQIAFTINNNKYINNGQLVNGTVTNGKRASTDVIDVFANKIMVVPKYGYTVSVGGRSNNVWENIAENSSDAVDVDLTGFDAFFLKISSDSVITQTDDADVYINVSNEIDLINNNLSGLSDESVSQKTTIILSTESTELEFNVLNGIINDSSRKIESSESSNNRCVWAEISGGYSCVVSKTAGKRFIVGFTTEIPANNVICLEDGFTVDYEASSISVRAPQTAKYIVAYVYNVSLDTITAQQMIDSVSIEIISAVDTVARNNALSALEDYNNLCVNANKGDLWEIGGLGSAGEDYNARNYNIRSNTYLQGIMTVLTDESYATRYVLYGSNKAFIYRSDFIFGDIDIMAIMKNRNATYVKFEVQAYDGNGNVITTPLANVDRYSHVSLNVLRDSGLKTDIAAKWYEDLNTQNVFLDRIKQAKYVYANNDSGVSTHPVLTLLHFTDVHGNINAMKYVLDINAIFESEIDDILHTGDTVVANLSDGITNWVNSGCAAKVLNVIGNHDTEENLVLQAAGKDNVYNTIFAPYISGWDVTQPTGVDTSGSDYYHALYYYKDYDDAEVRLIVLDTNFWDTTQKTWLGNVLTDALTNGLCVVIACHNVKLLTEMTDSNFSSYKGDGINETTNAYANQPADWLDPVQSFIDNGGNFACILAGHNHDGHMGTMTNYPDIFVYVSDKASISRVSGAARIAGEINANAVSVITINPIEKLFKIVKIGAQVDGKMRPQNVFCYDYDNHRIVSQW